MSAVPHRPSPPIYCLRGPFVLVPFPASSSTFVHLGIQSQVDWNFQCPGGFSLYIWVCQFASPSMPGSLSSHTAPPCGKKRPFKADGEWRSEYS